MKKLYYILVLISLLLSSCAMPKNNIRNCVDQEYRKELNDTIRSILKKGEIIDLFCDDFYSISSTLILDTMYCNINKPYLLEFMFELYFQHFELVDNSTNIGKFFNSTSNLPLDTTSSKSYVIEMDSLTKVSIVFCLIKDISTNKYVNMISARNHVLNKDTLRPILLLLPEIEKQYYNYMYMNNNIILVPRCACLPIFDQNYKILLLPMK